jgi:hypothetical protein
MAEIGASGDLTLTQAQMQARWFYEGEKLHFFPAFALVGLNGRVTAASGAIETQYGNTYGIRIELANYPFALPNVFPQEWTIHPAVTHKYNNGALCIMRSDQWRQHFTIALVVAKTAIWLGKYELWKRNGNIWPGLGQRH